MLFTGFLKNSIYKFSDSPVLFLYHRISSEEQDPFNLSVSAENFYEQLKFLQSEGVILTFEEFDFLRAGKKKFPKKSFLITFDDGYRDNFYKGLPILENLGIQAVFFISTGYIELDKNYWWDELSFLFYNNNRDSISIRIDEKVRTFNISNKKVRRKVLFNLRNLLLQRNFKEQQDFLGELKKSSGMEVKNSLLENSRVLSVKELLRFEKSKCVVIGAHTKFHPKLSCLTFSEQVSEIEGSKRFLEQKLEKKIDLFAYPFGQLNEYNRDSVRIVSSSGFKYGFSNFKGKILPGTSDYELPRYSVENLNKLQFVKWYKGFNS